MRRMAASALPPIQIGIGRCTGSGLMPACWMRVVLAVEVDELFGPERAQQRDLLLDAAAAVVEVLAERLELDGVPADADAEPQAAAGEHVDLRRLLGDERGLALRQDDDAGRELDRAW